MNKKVIRLTESYLHKIINESVRNVLINEGFFDKLFGKKKKPQVPVQQVRTNPMADRIRMGTKANGRIADDNAPIDERICVNGTMDGLGDRTYFGKKGSLPWYYQSYPNVNGRQGFNHTIKEKNGGRFSQIQYFNPMWSRGGGVTITFWKVLSNQELQRVQQIVCNETFENGIMPFVQRIDSVLIKQ